MNSWIGPPEHHGPDKHSPIEHAYNPHVESFKEWIDEDIEQVGDALWMPPMRNTKTGHRVSVGPYKPIGTRHLNWRWWLAEIPMRMLARHMNNAAPGKDTLGEEYIGGN
jgi:hypothetical protein